jgi:Protein of unknown function (DUF2933)
MLQNEQHESSKGMSRSTWVLLGFLAVAAYFLLSEHRAHFVQFLPFLLLLACPLMHLFHGHGGHGGHGVHGGDERAERADGPPAQRRPRSEGHTQ